MKKRILHICFIVAMFLIATATLVGCDLFGGKTQKVEKHPLELSALTFSGNYNEGWYLEGDTLKKTFAYTGEEIAPFDLYKVKAGGKDSGFTLSYANNVAVGKASCTVTMDEGEYFSGSVTFYFNIVKGEAVAADKARLSELLQNESYDTIVVEGELDMQGEDLTIPEGKTVILAEGYERNSTRYGFGVLKNIDDLTVNGAVEVSDWGRLFVVGKLRVSGVFQMDGGYGERSSVVEVDGGTINDGAIRLGRYANMYAMGEFVNNGKVEGIEDLGAGALYVTDKGFDGTDVASGVKVFVRLPLTEDKISLANSYMIYRQGTEIYECGVKGILTLDDRTSTTDYSVDYLDNTRAGTAYVRVVMDKHSAYYYGECKKAFAIEKGDCVVADYSQLKECVESGNFKKYTASDRISIPAGEELTIASEAQFISDYDVSVSGKLILEGSAAYSNVRGDTAVTIWTGATVEVGQTGSLTARTLIVNGTLDNAGRVTGTYDAQFGQDSRIVNRESGTVNLTRGTSLRRETYFDFKGFNVENDGEITLKGTSLIKSVSPSCKLGNIDNSAGHIFSDVALPLQDGEIENVTIKRALTKDDISVDDLFYTGANINLEDAATFKDVERDKIKDVFSINYAETNHANAGSHLATITVKTEFCAYLMSSELEYTFLVKRGTLETNNGITLIYAIRNDNWERVALVGDASYRASESAEMFTLAEGITLDLNGYRLMLTTSVGYIDLNIDGTLVSGKDGTDGTDVGLDVRVNANIRMKLNGKLENKGALILSTSKEVSVTGEGEFVNDGSVYTVEAIDSELPGKVIKRTVLTEDIVSISGKQFEYNASAIAPDIFVQGKQERIAVKQFPERFELSFANNILNSEDAQLKPAFSLKAADELDEEFYGSYTGTFEIVRGVANVNNAEALEAAIQDDGYKAYRVTDMIRLTKSLTIPNNKTLIVLGDSIGSNSRDITVTFSPNAYLKYEIGDNYSSAYDEYTNKFFYLADYIEFDRDFPYFTLEAEKITNTAHCFKWEGGMRSAVTIDLNGHKIQRMIIGNAVKYDIRYYTVNICDSSAPDADGNKQGSIGLYNSVEYGLQLSAQNTNVDNSSGYSKNSELTVNLDGVTVYGIKIHDHVHVRATGCTISKNPSLSNSRPTYGTFDSDCEIVAAICCIAENSYSSFTDCHIEGPVGLYLSNNKTTEATSFSNVRASEFTLTGCTIKGGGEYKAVGRVKASSSSDQYVYQGGGSAICVHSNTTGGHFHPSLTVTGCELESANGYCVEVNLPTPDNIVLSDDNSYEPSEKNYHKV